MKIAILFSVLIGVSIAEARRDFGDLSEAVSGGAAATESVYSDDYHRNNAWEKCKDNDEACIMDNMSPSDIKKVFGPYLQRRDQTSRLLVRGSLEEFMAHSSNSQEYYNVRITACLDCNPSVMEVKVKNPQTGQFEILEDEDGCPNFLISGGAGSKSAHIRGKCFIPHALLNKPPTTGNGMINSIFFSGTSSRDDDLDRSFAIHATNHISKLGSDVSSGCIRTDKRTARRLHGIVHGAGYSKTLICVDGKAKPGTRTTREAMPQQKPWIQPARNMGNGNARKSRGSCGRQGQAKVGNGWQAKVKPQPRGGQARGHYQPRPSRRGGGSGWMNNIFDN